MALPGDRVVASNRKARHDFSVLETVEAGHMTKDLATLIGPEQVWQTSEEYLGTIADHLKKALD